MTTDDSLTTIPADDCTPPPIRTAADLLAALPYQLGFRPEDSVVLTTLCRAPGARTKTLGPLARLDVEGLIDPDAGDVVAGAATTRMVGPDAERVLLVCYVPETFGAARLDPDLPTAVTTVDDALPGGGPRVEPSDVWVVATDGWGHLAPCDCCAPSGEPLDVLETSAVAAGMVLTGKVALGAREELAVTPVGGPDRAAADRAAEDESTRRARLRPGEYRRAATQLWDRTCGDPAAADPADLGRLAVALADTVVRDAAVAAAVTDARAADLLNPREIGRALDRGGRPREKLRLACRLAETVAAHAPHGAAAPALGLLAYLAWWSGDGARADVVARQALTEDPEHRLAHLVAATVGSGVPPPWVAHPS